jgi:hypothetical protein
MEGNPPPKRRWWRRLPARLSLRALMVLVLLLGGVLGWSANRARRQGEAIQRVARLGGRIGYDYNYMAERGNYPPAKAADPPAPRWLLRWLGPEYFRRVNFVSLAEHTSGRARDVPDLAFLDGLPDVVVIDLAATRFADAELAHARPHRLIRLLAGGSRLGDEGLARLGAKPELWELDLSGSRVSDVGMVHLAGMPKLRDLDLGGLSVTDGGAAALARLTGLKRLVLARTAIGDAGLAHLRGLDRLEFLDLRGTVLTDAALAHIGAMPALKAVYLPSGGVTALGIAGLRRLAPQLRVEREQPPAQGFRMPTVDELMVVPATSK